MIVELTAENVAILDRADLSLGPGFTVLTGETGAGKSLLVDAIELALGARGDSDLVRAGAARASVSLTLDLSGRDDLAALAAEMGFPAEDGLLYIQREVLAEGRSQARIQGRMTPLSTLKALGRFFVDLHGQHDHQSLLHPENHAAFLDAWIGCPATDLLAKVADDFSRVSDLERKLQAVRTGRREREQRVDLLRFQVEEIEAVSPVPAESEELESTLSRLRHVEKLADIAEETLQSLSRSEGSAIERLSHSVKEVEEAGSLDSQAQPALKPLKDALYALEDAVRLLGEYAEGIESDPERLKEISDRLEDLRKLRRKYGDDEVAVLAHLESARSELALLAASSESEDDLTERLDRANEALSAHCAKLSALRGKDGKRFAGLVEAQLRELAMESSKFESRLLPKPMDASGSEGVEFYFSANPGEPPRPLAKIASGGEIARLMLALKTVLAGKAGVPTLIFDEVESGLGGPTAAVVGKKLEELSRHCQVIVISHLPQIAGRASAHFRIEKVERAGRTATKVRSLSPQERVEEIARMIAGESVGDTAKAHAVELLERT